MRVWYNVSVWEYVLLDRRKIKGEVLVVWRERVEGGVWGDEGWGRGESSWE